MSARVGSVSDNKRGGWYSYRSSKSAVNQLVKSFDKWLETGYAGDKALSVGLHPGTVKTKLSEPYWDSVEKGRHIEVQEEGGKSKERGLVEPERAAERLLGMLKELKVSQRGRIWDYKGEEVLP